MKTSSALAAVLVFGAALTATRAFAAAPDPAQALFDRGLEAFKAGRYDVACPALEQSYKLDPLPGALFTLAECELKRGHLAAASARYDEYLRVYAALPPDKQAKQAERERIAVSQRAAIASRVAELTLVLPAGAPRETQVMRDGVPVAAAALGVPALVDPGEHVITIQVPGRPPNEMRVSLSAGEKKGVALEVRLEAASSAVSVSVGEQSAESGQPSGANRTLIIAGGAVAGVAVVAGAIFVGLWASKGSSASSLASMVPAHMGCPPSGMGGSQTCVSLTSALDSQATFGNVAIGAFAAAGAVGIATLVYGLAGGGHAPRAGLVVAPSVTAQGGSVLLKGSF
jgi:hypothetical protein